MWGISNSCIILVIMIRSVFCSQICSELEFSEISKNTIYATDGTNLSIHFHLNTMQCSEIPDELIIKVSRDRNGRLLCKILLKVAENKCDLSDTSTSCYCPSSDGRMLFLKHVTKDDEGVYVWRWNENFKKEVHKNLTLKVNESYACKDMLREGKPNSVTCLINEAEMIVRPEGFSVNCPSHKMTSGRAALARARDEWVDKGTKSTAQWVPLHSPDLMSRDTMTTLSTPDADPPPVPDAKQPEVEVTSAIIPRASHQQDADNALDTKLIISSAILGGVVVVAVIGAVLIFCLRGQRRNNQTHSFSVKGVTKNSYQLPLSPSVAIEQARDIYEEIPDRAKLHNAGSRGCPGNTAPLHSQSSSVNITQVEPLLSGKAHSPESSVEYLSPVSVCTQQKG